MVRVDTVLDSWKIIREDTALAVEDLPAGELDFRATPEMMTFREIARHILEASHGLTGLLLAGEDNLATPDFRQKVAQQCEGFPKQLDAATLAAELRRALDGRLAELRRQPAEFFDGIITRFDGQKVTRLEMIQFIKEHELTHRAQLFLYLRLKGVVPATTRRRLAKQAGKIKV